MELMTEEQFVVNVFMSAKKFKLRHPGKPLDRVLTEYEKVIYAHVGEGPARGSMFTLQLPQNGARWNALRNLVRMHKIRWNVAERTWVHGDPMPELLTLSAEELAGVEVPVDG